MKVDDDNILKILTDTTNVFADTACACIETLFMKSAKVKSPWYSIKHIEIDCSYVLVMGGASNTFQSILTVGLNTDAIIELTGQNLGENGFCDVFGEFANIYCAMLMDRDDFTGNFGILNQTIPVIYTKGIPFLPFISGIQGTVTVNEKLVYIGFAIRKK